MRDFELKMITALLVLALCGALASCGGGARKKSHTTTSAHGTTTTSAPPSSKPLVTFDESAATSNGPLNMRVAIYDLRRNGPYLVLDFGIACLESSSTGCQPIDTFAPTSVATTTGEISGDSYLNELTASGVALVDPAAGKEYLAVRDSQGRPFTSKLPQIINDSATHLGWVRYAAPAASVTSLDVAFPDGGPQIPNVPISAASGPTAGGSLQAPQPAPFAQPPTSADTTGLTLPVENLVQTVGNRSGSDAESSTRATITLRSDVLFRFAKSNLTPAARAILAAVAARVKARALGTVQVMGYTDSIGTDAVNIPLSRARASSVVSALQPLTPGVRYAASGLGAADPIAPNTKPDGSDYPAGRALNRRVTIAFAVKARAKPTPPPAPSNTQTTPSPTAQPGSVTFTIGDPQIGAHTYTATVNSLFRTGSLLVLRMAIDCTGATPSGGSCNTETDWAGTNTAPPLPLFSASSHFDIRPFFSTSGFYLLDPSSGSEYIPMHDTLGDPLTANITALVGVHDTYQVWSYLPAPPASVSRLTLVTPGGTARLNGVPIASEPPAQS